MRHEEQQLEVYNDMRGVENTGKKQLYCIRSVHTSNPRVYYYKKQTARVNVLIPVAHLNAWVIT